MVFSECKSKEMTSEIDKVKSSSLLMMYTWGGSYLFCCVVVWIRLDKNYKVNSPLLDSLVIFVTTTAQHSGKLSCDAARAWIRWYSNCTNITDRHRSSASVNTKHVMME